MGNNNHTKGEWVASNYTYDFGIYSLDNNDNGNDIAIVRNKGGEGKANAKLIVKAVNNHDKLIEALKDCANDLKRMKRNEAASMDSNFDRCEKWANEQTEKYFSILQSIEQQ